MKKVAPIETRKSDHIRINLEQDVHSGGTSGLECYHLIHEALPELDLNAVDRVARKVAVFRKQAQLSEPLLALIEDFQRLAPRGLLAVVDLAQVQHAALSHLPGAQAPVLDHAEIAMLLAVFVPPVRFQMHRYRQNGRVFAR